MRVLIACEFSGVVRDAFIGKGHDAMSCDLLPTESQGAHYQGDVFDIINDGWDLMIAHPPCTYLTCSAEWAYGDGPYHQRLKVGTLAGVERRAAREEAIEFVMRLYNSGIPKVAIENPVGVLSSRWRKPDQIIQPYEYGCDGSKKTCLWLRGLPLLKPTKLHQPRLVTTNGGKRYVFRWGNQTDSGQNNEPPSKNQSKNRSVTWKGVADAMAEQWG